MPAPPGAEYPFGRAAGSFFLAGGEALLAAADRDPGRPLRPPLLAYGANASPGRLAVKLPGVPVAALAGRLRGWAIVHSAHVSPYGAVPATLVPAGPADVAPVHVLLVDPVGLEPLDATEPNYDRRRLDGVDLEVDRLGPIGVVEAYLSKWGPLLVGGAPVRLGARTQEELHRLISEGA